MKRRPRPLYDRVIVRAKSVEEVSKGGIILQPTNEERPREGTVLYVGKGKVDINGNLRPLDVKPGDTVLFGKYAGTEISIDGEVILVFREEEILMVVE
jgi:chaperonin GroES